jgi:cytochrome c peroxidase
MLPRFLLLLPLAGLAGLPQEPRVPADDLPAELSDVPPFGLPAAETTKADTQARATLGRRIFFDPILSSDRTIACASCHDPATGFADSTPLSSGVDGRKTLRNAPTLFNRAYGEHFMWDGRAETLEEQVLLPIENELEMDLPLVDAVVRLAEDDSYRAEFEAVYDSPPTADHLAAALAAFVRRLYLGDSPIDRFRTGEVEAITPRERAGLWLYESRGACWRCHSGANFTDESFHNTGVGATAAAPEDGRFAHTADEADRGRFKTPTLRGVALTGPYMHDGSLATLEDVVEFYRQGGHPNANLDERIAPIELSDDDAVNLVAFLRALSRTQSD